MALLIFLISIFVNQFYFALDDFSRISDTHFVSTWLCVERDYEDLE